MFSKGDEKEHNFTSPSKKYFENKVEYEFSDLFKDVGHFLMFLEYNDRNKARGHCPPLKGDGAIPRRLDWLVMNFSLFPSICFFSSKHHKSFCHSLDLLLWQRLE